MARVITMLVAIVVVVGVVLAATGVLRFENGKDESIIKIDKKELKEKAQGMVTQAEKTEGKILEKTGEALHKAADRLQGSPQKKELPPTVTPNDDSNMKNMRGAEAGNRPPGPEKDNLHRQPSN